MKNRIWALRAALVATVAVAGTAQAYQSYGSSGQGQQQQQQQQQGKKEERAAKGGATVMVGDRKVTLSAEFASAYQQAAASVDSNDAALPAKIAAVQAAAKSQDERFLAAQLRLKVGMAAKNEAEMGAAIEAMLATGMAPAAQVPVLHLALGKARFNAKQYAPAAAEFEKVLQASPNNEEALSLLAQSRILGGQTAEGIAVLQKAIAQRSAGGAKAPEDLYKRAIAAAYKANMPVAVELGRQWVTAYPTVEAWSDALRIYRNVNSLDDAATLDVLRLARAANALKGEADYDRYGYAALTKGFPAEAKAVLEEGIKAGDVSAGKSPFKEMIAQANAKSAGETADKVAAGASGAKTAKAALAAGDALYGYGQYAKAAEVYRAALGKPGADASLINLHLGMALARAGDKAGATAALNAVTGSRAELAKFWLAYLATKA